MNRRTILKYGALGAAAAALPACDERPLPGESLVSSAGSAGAAGSGTGGAQGSLGTGGAISTTGASGAGGGAGGTGGMGGTTGVSCSPAISAGNAGTIAMGTLMAVGGRALLGRDAGGLYAMSIACTHQGCAVSVIGSVGQESLACPCHGSAFDANGAVTRGPARTPLPHYQVELAADGTVNICVGAIVPGATRTPV